MKTIVAIVTVLLSLGLQAQQINITPKPVSVIVNDGSYEITPQTKIFLAKQTLQNSADFFNDYLQKFYGFRLTIATKQTNNNIEFTTVKDNTESKHADGYSLKVDKSKTIITGANDAGVFYGMQTLIQLLPLALDQFWFL